MSGDQRTVEAKLALDAERENLARMDDSLDQIDQEMARIDGLLYEMIPKSVADTLREGKNPLDTCEVTQKILIKPFPAKIIIYQFYLI